MHADSTFVMCTNEWGVVYKCKVSLSDSGLSIVSRLQIPVLSARALRGMTGGTLGPEQRGMSRAGAGALT